MKKRLVLAIYLCSLLFAQLVQAESGGELAARGMMIGEIMNEMCSGIRLSESESQQNQQKMVAALGRQGFSDDDIKRGFAGAVGYVYFIRPPGKPTRSECREATQIHKATLSLIR
jgi:predicted DNA-binding transcriptional regulator